MVKRQNSDGFYAMHRRSLLKPIAALVAVGVVATAATSAASAAIAPAVASTASVRVAAAQQKPPFTRSFTLAPMGTRVYHTELYETAQSAASRLEPVGLYLDVGDVVYVDIRGGTHLEAQIGMGADLDGRFQRAPLGTGLNQVIAKHEGPLFLANESSETSARVSVYADGDIKRIPTFRLGESNERAFQAEVEAATDVPKIFLIGNSFMAYVSREVYLQQNVITKTTPIIESPTAFLKKRDRDVEEYHRLANKDASVGDGNANSVQNSREYATTGHEGYMDARDGFIQIVSAQASMARLFDLDAKPSGESNAWSVGPWHELGHHQQQYLMAFNNADEAAPNIYKGHLSLISGNGYGFGIGTDRLPKGLYASKNAPADATGLTRDDMLFMYMQLYAAFGEGFYQRLQHEYRLIDNGTAARLNQTTGEWSNFAYLASKASQYDLTPFFQAWKFPISAEDKAKIAAMRLRKPSKDLAAQTLTDIKSPADLRRKYQRRLSPYTNLPVADPKSDFMFRWGLEPSPYDLITYDPKVVKKAEFLNPWEEPFKVALSGKNYGATMVEILLTGFDGQQNVVIVTGMIKPPEWSSYSLHSTVYNQVKDYVNSADFKAGNVDIAEAEKHLEMIEGTIGNNTADLIKQLNDGIDKANYRAHGGPNPDAYFFSFSDNNTLYSYSRPSIQMDTVRAQDMIDHGSFEVRAYQDYYNKDTKKYLGFMRNGAVMQDDASLNLLKSRISGTRTVVYVDASFGTVVDAKTGTTLNNVTFELLHRDVHGDLQKVLLNMDPRRYGTVDNVSADWVDNQFRSDMVYLENGNRRGVIIFSLPEDAWNTMKRAGDIYLEVYRNGEKVGWADGTTYRSLRVTIQDGIVNIRTPNSGVRNGDLFELKGTFKSRVNNQLSGSIYLPITANMLSDYYRVGYK